MPGDCTLSGFRVTATGRIQRLL